MPMPNSTTIRITWIELSVLRSKTLLAPRDQPDRPPARPGRSRGCGSSARITLRKIRTSRSRISSERREPDDRLGLGRGSCGVEGLGGRPGHRRAAGRCRRPRLGVLAQLLGGVDRVGCRSRFLSFAMPDDGELRPACSATAAGRRRRRTPGRPCLEPRRRRSCCTSAVSAAVSLPPSVRSKTRIAPTLVCCGNASAGGSPPGSTRTSTAGTPTGPRWTSASGRAMIDHRRRVRTHAGDDEPREAGYETAEGSKHEPQRIRTAGRETNRFGPARVRLGFAG